MRPVALVIMFCLMSCSGTCEQGCAPAFAEDPRPWRRVAASATEADIGWVDQHLLRLPADRRELVEQVLDRMAMAGTGPSALTRAGEIAAQDQNVANDPMWDGSGMAPGSAASDARRRVRNATLRPSRLLPQPPSLPASRRLDATTEPGLAEKPFACPNPSSGDRHEPSRQSPV